MSAKLTRIMCQVDACERRPECRNGIQLKSCNKCIHHDIMTETSTHHKEMKNLMGTEVLVAGVEDRKFQCIDHTANGVNDSACEQPAEGFCREGRDNLAEREDADPAHRNVDD